MLLSITCVVSVPRDAKGIETMTLIKLLKLKDNVATIKVNNTPIYMF